jgi:hypothetical protein
VGELRTKQLPLQADVLEPDEHDGADQGDDHPVVAERSRPADDVVADAAGAVALEQERMETSAEVPSTAVPVSAWPR